MLGLAVLDVNLASADNSSNPRDTIIQKLAEKFNLKESDVQQVFDEVRQEHQTQMQTKHEERLSQLVTDGKITEDQKALILNKHKELQAERESNKDSFKDLSPEQRKIKMEEKKIELETWANENGIDTMYIMHFGEKGNGDHGSRIGDM